MFTIIFSLRLTDLKICLDIVCKLNVYCSVYFYLDIDECKEQIFNCHADALCNNTNGSYNCTCKAGFSGDGHVCAGKTFLNDFKVCLLVVAFRI